MKKIGDEVRRILEDLEPPAGTAPGPEPAEEEEVCPICKGVGFYVLDVPVDHPDFGRAIPCVCQREDWERRRLQRLQRLSPLESLRDKTFDTFSLREGDISPAEVESLRKALAACMEFAADPRGWLLLIGGLGCGKTHLAAAIANARLAQGEPALFIVVPDLLDHLRATFHPGSGVSYDERFEEIRGAPLLILDDLGAESSTSWAQEKLYQIVNYRYNARLPTVFTTNVPLEEIEPRIRSRLLDHTLTTICRINAPDFRVRIALEEGPELNALPFLQDKTFATWDDRRDTLARVQFENLEMVYNAARAYAEAPHNWFVLVGDYGTGKTHLAAAIANERVRRGDQVLFVSVPDLLDYLRAAFSPDSTVSYARRFEEVKRIPFLVLDDLSTESATPWAREKLYQLLNFRHMAGLPTVITIARPLEYMNDPDNVRLLSKIDERIRVRLLDPRRCTIYKLKVPAYVEDPDRKPRRRRRRA